MRLTDDDRKAVAWFLETAAFKAAPGDSIADRLRYTRNLLALRLGRQARRRKKSEIGKSDRKGGL